MIYKTKQNKNKQQQQQQNEFNELAASAIQILNSNTIVCIFHIKPKQILKRGSECEDKPKEILKKGLKM